MTARKMTEQDYAELGIPVPEYMRPPWNGTLDDLVGRTVRVNVREFYQGFVEQRPVEGTCPTCGEHDSTEGPLCEGCGSCQSCCNCTETDCDCDSCTERRENDGL